MLVKASRVFSKLVLQGCVDWAKENGCKEISKKEMQIVSDKRSKEKKRGQIKKETIPSARV